MDADLCEGWFLDKPSWHFYRRLYERHNGMVLDYGEYSDIVRRKQKGCFVARRKDAHGDEVCAVPMRNGTVVLIVAFRGDKPVTVLPGKGDPYWLVKLRSVTKRRCSRAPEDKRARRILEDAEGMLD